MLHFENNKSKRINPKQKQILYAAMATNRNILDCISGDSDVRRTRKAVWKRVALELNMAGPKKDITQWRKVWTDLRLGMRKKWDKAQKSEYILTEYERRVIDACGMVEDCREKSAEEINSFLAFLQEELNKEHKLASDNSDYYREGNSNSSSYYLADSSEFIIRHCQPPDADSFKDEFDKESAHFVDYEENSVEYISDDDRTSRMKDFREPSVECISDDEGPIITNETKESPPHLSYEEEEEPILAETVPRPMPLDTTPEAVPQPILLQCPPELPPMSLSLSSTILPRRKKLKSATLKEIKKMHRNLLKESKKQTVLLRKLVQAMRK